MKNHNSSSFSSLAELPSNSKIFLSGQAGSGKTSAAVKRMLFLINEGIPAESILILVPQRSFALPYQNAVRSSAFMAGGEPAILTIGGLAQRSISLFWPLIAHEAGFTNPHKAPNFLTLETTQYFLAGIIEPLLKKGYFESVMIDPTRLYSQILDNLNKSAVVGFPPEEIASRLIQAWSGKPSQSIIYEQAQECALLFRNFCLQKNLLDFSLQISIFSNFLCGTHLFHQTLIKTYQHLIYDNVEEDYPIAHDIVRSWLPELESALIINDLDSGVKVFMGADPISAAHLAEVCDESIEIKDSLVKTHELDLLEKALVASIRNHRIDRQIDPIIENAFSIHSFRFFPQLIEWVTQQVKELITKNGVSPSEIVILTPFLSDSMRYAFSHHFADSGLAIRTLRPSRGLIDEPAVNAILTLVKLAFSNLGLKLSRDEVRNALLLTIADCDYIRADLIAQVLFNTQSGTLRSFDPINKEMQQRITYTVGERFERLRKWLEEASKQQIHELDIFISKLFGEILSQPGYKFHEDYDSAAATNRLVESAKKFRLVMAEPLAEENIPLNPEFIRLVESGILSAQYLSDWTKQESTNSVLLSPAFSFLMNNQPCRFQFWLDIGSQGWWTRLDQPLTQPHVLNRNWQPGDIWTDYHETNTNQNNLSRIVSGLIRRCGDHIFMCSLNINEQGNEERGPLIMAVQSILRCLNAQNRSGHV